MTPNKTTETADERQARIVAWVSTYDPQLASAIEREFTPPVDPLAEALSGITRTASGESWAGIPVVAYHWEEPSRLPPPSSQTIDRVVFHWSTGPKEGQPLVRLSDVITHLPDMIRAAPECIPNDVKRGIVEELLQKLHWPGFTVAALRTEARKLWPVKGEGA